MAHTQSVEAHMSHPLFLLLPFVLAATRSFAFGVQSPTEPGARPAMAAETEFRFLVIAILCLTGLLATLGLMIWFPDLGAVIAEYNQN